MTYSEFITGLKKRIIIIIIALLSIQVLVALCLVHGNIVSLSTIDDSLPETITKPFHWKDLPFTTQKKYLTYWSKDRNLYNLKYCVINNNSTWSRGICLFAKHNYDIMIGLWLFLLYGEGEMITSSEPLPLYERTYDRSKR